LLWHIQEILKTGALVELDVKIQQAIFVRPAGL